MSAPHAPDGPDVALLPLHRLLTRLALLLGLCVWCLSLLLSAALCFVGALVIWLWLLGRTP